ncbi:tachykinins [Galleria mellonella]|uniref:Tachykinin-related peptide n=1 Tax=Galleria mellonella TaxID=7137 RepID=A0A6J1WYC5_GALME|nr:tachykinins [Galleria mellonella]WLY76871.1 tachykinin-related peptide [Galleria mellonella]
MGTSRTCLFFITMHLIYAASAQDIEKRVPKGFLGMRGKKYDSASSEQFYKRRPQFFVGVKGKKSFLEALENYEYKRAPMGFVGMRGKKESYIPNLYYPDSYEYVPKRDGSLIGQIDYASSDETRQFDENEFPVLNDFLTEYLQKLERPEAVTEATVDNELTNERITNEVDKRAANMHQFYGVRGKKSVQDKRPYDLTFRGKFIGVRGKKDTKNSAAQEVKFLLNGPWPKRKAQMGFFGMRGKKWIDDASPEMETPN